MESESLSRKQMSGGRLLDEDEVALFGKQGYVAVPGFLGVDAMARMANWCDEIVAWPELPGRHMLYREDHRSRPGVRVLSRIENFCPYHRELDALLRGARVMACLQALFGEPAVLFKDKINFKVPGCGGFEAHQDVQAGWDRYASLHITLLLSIDAATPENGALEMAPGWHDRGVIGRMWTPLGETVPSSAYRACPTAPGDAVFFDSFAPHRSAPNLTDRARRVLYVTYNRASEGDQRQRYYADKRESYPPDCERDAGKEYVFRV
jgi:hypothetical protein